MTFIFRELKSQPARGVPAPRHASRTWLASCGQRTNAQCCSRTNRATCWIVSVPLGVGCLGANCPCRKETDLWMAGTTMQSYPPRSRIETLILYTILNHVHFPSITTFGLIPFLLFESSVQSFTVLNNPDISFQYHKGTLCTDELQSLDPGSPGHMKPHLRPSLCPASLIIYEGIPKKVLETLLAWAKPQSRQIFRERSSKRQIFI